MLMAEKPKPIAPYVVGQVVGYVDKQPERQEVDLRHFVLLTEPMGERKAADYLKDFGFEPYVPLFQKTVIHHVRRFGRSEPRAKKVPWPIFCGYLFLPLNVAWGFGPLNNCPGLRQGDGKFLTDSDNRPKVLSDAELKGIQDVEIVANYKEKYRIGDEILILNGPFADTIANIEELDDAERIKVLMDIFGRKVPVTLHVNQIAKLP